MGRAHKTTTLIAGVHLFARAYWPAAALLVLGSVLAAVATAVALGALSDLAWAQRNSLFADGTITASGILRLTLLVGVPAALTIAALAVITIAAVAVVQGDVRLGRRANLPAAVAVGTVRAGAFAGALAIAVLEVLMAVALAPVITIVAIVILIVRGVIWTVARLRPKTPPRPARVSPWLSWRMLVVYAIPFGLAATIWANSLLILPVAVHERRGPIGVLRRSSELTQGRVWRIVAIALIGAVSYVLVQFGIDSLRLTGMDSGLVGWLFALSQPLLAGLPIALLVAAYFTAIGDDSPTPAVIRPALARRPLMATTATAVTAALVVGLVVGLPSSQAWATDDTTGTPGTEASETLASTDQPAPDAGTLTSETPPGETPPGETPPGETPPGETPPGEGGETPPGEGGETPPGEGGGEGGGPRYPLSLYVDSLGDETDAVPGDGICATAEGTCTVRAAVVENNAYKPAGVSKIIAATAEIASGTVVLTTPITVTYPLGFEPKYDFPDASGMTLDGAHATQLVRFDAAWGQTSQWDDLTLTRGYAGAGAQGGAVEIVRGKVWFQRVVFANNHATSGAQAVYAPDFSNNITTTQSHFVDNAVPACFPDGFLAQQIIFPLGMESTIDVEDDSCPGTVSSTSSVSTSVSVEAAPSSPRRGGTVSYSAVVTPTQPGLDALGGTVTFQVDGQDPIVVAVPTDGRVQTTAIVPALPSYTVRVSYSGSSGYRASLGQATVTTAGSTSSVALNGTSDLGNDWYRGHPLTLTADVSSGTPGTVPTGTVTFSAEGVELGSSAVDADGRASFDTTVTTADGWQHSGGFRWDLEASYSGDAEHPVADVSKDVFLAADRTKVTITPSVATAAPGDSVSFIAKVTSLEPGAGAVSAGSLTFSTPQGLAQPVAVNAHGEATITVAGIGLGTHRISASYGAATSRFLPSSGLLDYSVTGSVDSITTITRLTPTVSAPGDNVEFLIGVDTAAGVPAGVPSPSGIVRLFLGSTLLHEVALTGNTTVRTNQLPLGVSTVRVEYLGDQYHRGSSASVTQTVAKVPTRTWLSASQTSTVIGEPVQFTVSAETATVGQISQPLTSGIVEVYVGATRVAQIDLAGGGTATVPLPEQLGDQTVRAMFLADDRNAGSQSTGYVHRQSLATALVQLSVADATLAYDGLVDASVTATGVLPSLLNPAAGTVRILSNGVEVAQRALETDGTARFLIDASVLLPGTRSLTAVLSGNQWFGTSTSAATSVTIAKHTPAVSLTATGTGQSVWGQNVSLTATVEIPWTPAFADIPEVDAAPLGTIEFTAVSGGASILLGSQSVTEQRRTATLAIDPTDLPVGAQEFRAHFTPSVQTTARLTTADAAPVAHTVLPVPVTVSIGGLDGILPGASFLRSITVREDAAHTTALLPAGTVTVTIDGAPLGTFALVPVAVAQGSIANVSFPAVTTGEHRIAVHYTPAAATPHRLQAQEFTFTTGAVAPVMSVAAGSTSVDWDETVWIQASAKKRFDTDPEPRGTIVVSDGTAAGASCEIRVIPGDSQPQTACPLFWPTAGTRTIQAVFTPADTDLTYSSGTSSTIPIEVKRRTVSLTGGITHSGVVGGAWIDPTAGDTLTATWYASGFETGGRAPAGALAVSITPTGTTPPAGCDTGIAAGSCVFPLTIADSEQNAIAVTVSYPGDDRYTAASWTGSVRPRACVAVALTVAPAGAGAITPSSAPTCGEPAVPKSGYAVGTVLSFTTKALPSGDLAYAWTAPETVQTATGADSILTVSPTANWAKATFTKSYNCTIVSVISRSLRGTSGEVVLPGQKGSTDPAPNCPAAMAGGSLPAFSGWKTTNSVEGTQSLRVSSAAYLFGTELGFALIPGRTDTKLYAYSSSGGWQREGDWAVARRAVGTGGSTINVTFGPTCYAATATPEGRGTTEILTAQNCSDPTTGTTGWYADTVLDVYASPTVDQKSYPFVRTWIGTDRVSGTTELRGHSWTSFRDLVLVRNGKSTTGIKIVDQVDTVRVFAGAPAPAITVAFGECRQLSVVGQLPSVSYSSTSVDSTRKSIPGNCPHPDASAIFYDEGTELTIEAIPPAAADGRSAGQPVSQTQFSGWQIDKAESVSTRLVTENPITVRMDRNHDVRANFHFLYDCAQINVRSTDPASVSVALSLPGVEPYCDRGTLETSGNELSGTVPRLVQREGEAPVGQLVLSAQPTAGLNPLLGWTLTSTVRDYTGKYFFGDGSWTETRDTRRTYTNQVAGATVWSPLNVEYLSAKAVACQQIDANVDMVTEDGAVLHDFDNDDQLILVYPAPNCPFVQNAYLVGTQVELWALGNPLGYSFTGWGGDLAAGSPGDVASSQLAAEMGTDSAFLDEDFPSGVLRTVMMDGKSPVLSVIANYNSICYDVTIEEDVKHVSWYPQPNCPGAEGKVITTEYSDKHLLEVYGGTQQGQARDFNAMRKMAGPRTMTGSFVGGSEVLIQATSIDNYVWTGWRGDVVQTGRVNPGTISVLGDKVVQNTYRGKDFVEGLDDFGNDVAVFAKKAVGFTAIVFTEYLKYYPPLGAVTGIADGMSLVGTVLELAGVSPNDTKYLHYAKQMIDLPFSLISCAGTWGLGGDTGIVAAAASNTASVLKQGTYRITNITDAAMDEAKHVMKMQAGDTGIYMSAKLQYYTGKLALAELAPKIAPAIGIGVAVYGAIEGVGVTWDSSASSAWTDGSGYTDCLRKAVPQFMYDALGSSGENAVRKLANEVASRAQSGQLWESSGQGATP